MRVMQTSYAAGVLAPSLHARTDLAKWQIGLAQANNMLVHVHGGISNRPGTRYVGDALGQNRLIEFEYSADDTYALEFTEYKMRIIRDGGFVVYPVGHPSEGDIVEIVSPFAYADLKDVRYVQREDVMYFTHPDYSEQVLTRTDHHDWAFATTTYTPDIAAPTNLAGSRYKEDGGAPAAGTTDYDIDYVVAAISLTGEESLPSTLVTVGAEPSTSWTAGYYNELTWDAVTGADLYVVYKNSRGYYGYIGSTTDTTFRDDNIAPDSADGPKTSRDPFNGADNKPGSVGIYQQRKVYGRSNNSPQTTWLTQSGTMDNLSVSRPLKDTDAITAQLDSNQVNQILHYVPMKDLVVVTNNGVWTLSSGANNDALTPTTVRYDLQSADGGSYIRPIVSGNTILMVPSYRNGAKEIFYQIQAGGFESSDLHLLANHLFKNDKIIDWAYQRDDSIVWCVMESGNLCSLTYLRAHDVVAWTTHDTQGAFESVTVVKNDSRDIPYFGVLRTVNGSQVRFIEELCERLPGDVLEDSCFLDAAVSYDGAATDTFTGADHLAGETCTVLADGNVIEDVDVDLTGGFTLPYQYSKVHLGIGYVADFETLDVDYQGQEGPGFGNLKNITEVTLSLENTRGIKVGPDSDNLTEMKFRTDEDYNEATRLFTGKKDITIEPMWESNGRIHVQQPYPLPVTILSHIPEVVPGDE